MPNRKKVMIKCPICGLVSWQTRLKGSYPLKIMEVKSEGRGRIKDIFHNWDAKSTLGYVFQEQFYRVLEYLLVNRYVDASSVKKLADTYAKAGDVFHPDFIFDSGCVYKQDIVYTPKFAEKRR